MDSLFRVFFSWFGTVFVYMFGHLDIALQSLLIFIVLDYITGMMKSYKNKTLNSNRGFKGILKKVGVLCVVAVACVVDRICGETGLIRTSVIYYLCANEGLSIAENLSTMGVLVPNFLKERLEQLRDKEGEKE